MRVVIVEDNVLLREGIIRLLGDHAIDVVAWAADVENFQREAERHCPDLAIVDVRLPPSFTDEGLRAAIEWRGVQPGAPVLVLSQFVEERYARELLADGAGSVGYLLKDRVADVREFVEALHRVAGGATVLDPEVVAQLIARRARDPVELLTPRERDVRALMAEGRSNAGIAKRLVISDGAVEKHIANIFTKLGLSGGDDHRRVLAVLAWLGQAVAARSAPRGGEEPLGAARPISASRTASASAHARRPTHVRRLNGISRPSGRRGTQPQIGFSGVSVSSSFLAMTIADMALGQPA